MHCISYLIPVDNPVIALSKQQYEDGSSTKVKEKTRDKVSTFAIYCTDC